MPTITRYALDPTGVNTDNLVIGEVKTLSTTAVRAVAPANGPFFVDSLRVYDHGNGTLLNKGVDYEVVDLLQSATLKFGLEIAQVVLITNQSVGSTVRINYQVLGGPYQNNSEGLVNIYNAVMSDNRPVNWVDVLNKPVEYTPTLHRHLLEDVYGFEPLVVELERISNAIVLSNVPAFEALIEWVQANAGNTIITDPVIPTIEPNVDKVIHIYTSNTPNATKFYWSIRHTTTADENFKLLSGMCQTFQNRSNFTLKTSAVIPANNMTFDVVIRRGAATGPIVTVIEGITLIPQSNAENSVMDLINACCVMEPGIDINAKSMFFLG